MKRWTIRILVFLLLGAIVNVAVAWGCAAWIQLQNGAPTKRDVFSDTPGSSKFSAYVAYRLSRSGAHRVTVYKGAGTGRSPIATHGLEELIPAWGRDFLHIPELQDGYSDQRSYDPLEWGGRAVDARGWPSLALWGGIGDPDDSRKNGTVRYAMMRGWRVHGAVPLGDFPTAPPFGRSYVSLRLLPLAPIWPGFAINTVFYAVVLWLLFAAPFALRRWRRIKRGLCAKCAYPVGTSDKCTECGAAVQHFSRP